MNAHRFIKQGRTFAIFLSAVLFFVWVPIVFAVPIARWTTEWQVTFDHRLSQGNVIGNVSSFGRGALDLERRDLGFAGEIMNTVPLSSPQNAFIRQRAEVAGSPTSPSLAISAVQFQRGFRLTGTEPFSRLGWDVDLRTFPRARLFAENGGHSFITYTTSILNKDGATVLRLGQPFGAPPNVHLSVTNGSRLIGANSPGLAGLGIGNVPDGDYTVRGQSFAVAFINQPSESGRAIADMFTGTIEGASAGLQVQVAAGPRDPRSGDPGILRRMPEFAFADAFQVVSSALSVAAPEPATVLLIVPGLAGLAILRKRSSNSRSL